MWSLGVGGEEVVGEGERASYASRIGAVALVADGAFTDYFAVGVAAGREWLAHEELGRWVCCWVGEGVEAYSVSSRPMFAAPVMLMIQRWR